MTDYLAALSKGMSDGERVINNLKEIQGTFDEMARQIFEGTGIKIFLSGPVVNKLAQLIKNSTAEPAAVNSDILASRPSIPGEVSIGRWLPAETGYPVQLMFGGVTQICADKISLENSLSNMLKHPVVGKALIHLHGL